MNDSSELVPVEYILADAQVRTDDEAFRKGITKGFYISQVKVQDTASAYILGSSGAFAAPLFNGGTPSLTGTTACVIVQQFTVFSMNGSRYVMSSISACS